MDLLKALDPWNHSESEESRLEAVKKAVEKGADITVQDYRTKGDDPKIKSDSPSNNTPLHIAVLKKYQKVFAFLIKELRDDSRIETALEEINNKSETVLKLIRDQKNKNILQDIDLDKSVIEKINKMLSAPQQKSAQAKRSEKADKYEDLVFCLVERIGREKFPNSDFSIGREVKTRETDAQKFDDTVFSYKQDGNKYIIPIQVKHKGEDKKIDHHDLSDFTGEFSVPKYFLSYLDLRNDIKGITNKIPSYTGHNKENENKQFFKDSEIQHVVIFTSASVDTQQLDQAGFKLKDAPKGVIDIFDLSLRIGESNLNYKQLEKISDKLNTNLLAKLSEFEQKNGQKPSLTENEKKEEEEIKNFLNRLVFIINQPKVEDLEWRLSDLNSRDIFKDTVFNTILSDETFKRYKENLEKDLSKKGGRPSGWIDGEKARNLFKKQVQQVQTSLIVASMTVMYNKKVLVYGAFENLNTLTEVDKFLGSGNERVLCMQTSATLLSSIKLLQYLNTKQEYALENFGRISAALEEILQSDQHRKAIVEAFEHSNANLLTIECKDGVYNQESITHLHQALSSIIQPNSNKKIILITEANKSNILAKRFETSFKKRGKYFTTIDEIDIRNFKPKQDPLDKNLVVLQGEREKVNLNQLVGPSALDIIDVNTYVDLIQDKEINIGSKPLGISDLEGAYAEFFEEIKKDDCKTNLVDNSPEEVIYVISGIKSDNPSSIKDVFRSKLDVSRDEIDDEKINIFSHPYSIPSTDKTIQLVDSGFQEDSFKKLCNDYSDKKIYWIKSDKLKFILQKIYNPHFYINRQFNRVIIKNENDEKIKLTQEPKDKFVFSGINNNGLATLLGLQPSQLDDNRIYFIESSEAEAEAKAKKKFEEEKIDGTVNAIHWLQVENNGNNQQIIWRDSKGSLESLRKYVDEKNSQSLENQDRLFQSIKDKQAVIIADDPGMGKSTSLITLYQSDYGSGQKSKLVESHWVININLKDHLEAIRAIGADAIDIPKFLSKVDKNLRNDLAQNILKLALYSTTKFEKTLLIAFDGFDEVLDQKDRNNVISLLKYLKDNTQSKFWVTTRLQHKKSLEKALSTFAVTFEPLDDPLKKIFIKKFLKDRLRLLSSKGKFEEVFGDSDAVEENTRMCRYTESFLNKMQSVFKDDTSRFIGTPLQLYLLLGTEGSIKAFKAWVEGGSDSIPNFDYLGGNILEVYEKFIDGKYENYFRKLGIIQEAEKKSKKLLFNIFAKKLARRLVGASESDMINSHEDIVLSTGLIRSSGSGLEFIHPTFGEYFASEICMGWIQKESNFPNTKKEKFLLKDVLRNENYNVIRCFIDTRLKGKQLPEKTLEIYARIIEALWDEVIPPKGKKNITPLHIAAEEDNGNIASFLLNSLHKNNNKLYVLKKFVRIQTWSGTTALHIAAFHGSSHFIKVLVDTFKNDRKFLREIIGMHLDEESVLDIAVGCRSVTVNIIDMLLKPFEKAEEKLKSLILGRYAYKHKPETALHIAVYNRSADVIQSLLNWLLKVFKNKGEVYNSLYELRDILQTEENGNMLSVWELAVSNGFIEIVQVLLYPFRNNKRLLQEMILKTDRYRRTALHHTAALDGFVPMIKVLLKPFIKTRNKKLINFISKQDIEKKTALHLAAENGHYNVIVELIKHLKKNPKFLTKIISKQDIRKKTALHLAAENGHYNIIVELIEHLKKNRKFLTKIINIQDQLGNTALDLAIQNNYQSLVKVLLQNGGNKFLEKNIASILPEICPLGPSSGRSKREIGSCELSWEDDISNIQEGENTVNDLFNLKINSDKFLDLIRSLPISAVKLDQLIDLASKSEITSRSENVLKKLIKNKKVVSHLTRVGKVSGMTMKGMMGKNIVSDLINGNYTDVAINCSSQDLI